MATISNGESGSSVRTKLNEIINKVEGVTSIDNNIDITGTLTSDGLTVDGAAAINGANLSLDNSYYLAFRNAADTSDITTLTFDANDQVVIDPNQYGTVIGTSANPAFKVASNRDISFYEATGTTPKFFWDASDERLYIGDGTYNNDGFFLSDFGGGYQIFNTKASDIRIATNNEERMRIDSSGNVGIGTSSPASYGLSVEKSASTATGMNIRNVNTGSSAYAGIYFGGATSETDVFIGALGDNTTTYGGGRSAVFGTNASTPTVFTTGGTERMRIDSSGNLLVGTTDSTPYNNTTGEGIALKGDNIQVARDGATALFVNRMGTDGEIAEFYKSGSPVGTISTIGGDFVIGSSSGSDAAFRMDGTNNQIYASNALGNARDAAIDLGASSVRWKNLYLSGSAYTPVVQGLGDEAGLTFGGALVAPRKNNAAADGTVDLGASSARFKDLYLSGGVYLGGTTSDNLLDDYETGTWTPTLVAITTDFDSVTYDSAVTRGAYTKVGNIVTVTCSLMTDAVTVGSAAGSIAIAGLPFTSDSNYYTAGSVAQTLDWAGEEPSEALIFNGQDRISLFYKSASDGNSAALAVADVGGGGNDNRIYVSVTYRVA